MKIGQRALLVSWWQCSGYKLIVLPVIHDSHYFTRFPLQIFDYGMLAMLNQG